MSDELLHPDSFNPDFDTRLHDYYSSRVKKAFDPNYQSLKEKREADELIARTAVPSQEATPTFHLSKFDTHEQ